MTKHIAIWVLALASTVYGDVRLPALIGDNMVIQRGEPVRFWGWADANESITIKASWGTEKQFNADAHGRWKLAFDGPKDVGPHQITVQGKNTIELKDVLSGDVWVCTGQSNMEWPVERCAYAAQDIASADNPRIRLFKMKRAYSDHREGDCHGNCSSPHHDLPNTSAPWDITLANS